MLAFALIAVSITVAIQAYLYKKFVTYIQTTTYAKFSKIVAPIFIFFNLPAVSIFILRSIDLNRIPDFLIYPYAIWQGTTFFIFLALMLAKILMFPAKLFKPKRKETMVVFNKSRRKFLETAMFGISAYAFAGSTIGVLAKDDYKVENVKIKIKNLPEPLRGLTIALASDIHSGIFMSEEEMKFYASAINELNADLILLPGDFITSDPEEIYPFVKAFKNLKARYGIFATLGNHEFFRREHNKIAKIIEENGIRVLRNENEAVEINGEKIYIIGIDDLRYGADIDRATRGIENGNLKILLSHKPYAFPEFARRGIELTLSGHTHGGQIVFAKIDDTYIAPAALVSKFVAGHYKIDDSHLYVSRGLGVVGLPIRLNCPPEITKITLVS